jgi:hypothetical protein
MLVKLTRGTLFICVTSKLGSSILYLYHGKYLNIIEVLIHYIY